jgi:hypothetical protein
VTRTWQAIDECNNRTTCSQTVNVRDTTPPLLAGVPADLSLQCRGDVTPPAIVTATDNCDGSVAVTRVSSTNGACPVVIVHTWTATDACGNTSQASQTITVQSDPPAFTLTFGDRSACPGGETAFCMQVSSVCPVSFQWFKDGAALDGETDECLSLLNLTPAHAGQYCVVARTECHSLTNCATLTVLDPSGLPRVLSARITADTECRLMGVLVRFSKEMDPATVLNPANYTIPGVTIDSVDSIRILSNTVLLATSPLMCGGTYSLSLRGVRDREGLPFCVDPLMVTLTTTGLVCCNESFTLDLAAGYSLLANQLDRGDNRLSEVLPAVPEQTQVSVPNSLGGYETFTFAEGAWNGDATLPPGNGFFIYLPVPASLTFMGSRPTQRLPLSLLAGSNLAGRQVPERATFEDIVGRPPAEGTVLRRHIRGSSGTEMPSEYYRTHIYLDRMWSGGEPRMDRGEAVFIEEFRPVVITRQPASQIGLPLGPMVQFSVEASGSGPLRYQWRRNGVNIPGATNDTLVLPSAGVEDSGRYNVIVANAVNAVASEPAFLQLDIPTLPLRNDFAAAVTVTDTSRVGSNNNLEATPEPGEFNHAGKPVGKSMWINWAAPGLGVATFRTLGSSFDTVLAAYTGSSLATLVEIDADDDGGPFLSSVLRFQTVPGTVYHVVVDGYASDTGDIVLGWDFEPMPNPLPAILQHPRSVVTGLGSNVAFSVVATGLGLTHQWFFNGDPTPGATSPTLTLLNAQAANAGFYFVRVQRGADFLDSRIAELEFSHVGPSNEVQNVFSTDKFSDLILPSGNPLTATDPFKDGPVAQAASVVRGFTGTQIFSTVGSVSQPNEPLHCGVAGGASRWFAYIAPGDGMLTLNTEGSDFDTVLAVYTGTGFSFSGLTPVACDPNNGSNGVTSKVTFRATNNTLYYIAVDGENGARGTVKLNYALLLPVVLSDVTFTATSTSFKVTSTPGFPITVERSANYLNWTALFTTNSLTGTNYFTDTSPPTTGGRFYRVLQSP